jgi:hypothetical protein
MRKDPVQSEERRQQHLRKTILNSIIRRRAGLFWALLCGLTFFSDLLHFDTGLLMGLNAVALRRSTVITPQPLLPLWLLLRNLCYRRVNAS